MISIGGFVCSVMVLYWPLGSMMDRHGYGVQMVSCVYLSVNCQSVSVVFVGRHIVAVTCSAPGPYLCCEME